MSTENTNEIELHLPDASVLLKEKESVVASKRDVGGLGKKKSKFLYHGMGLVGVVAVISIILAISFTHDQATYNGSKEVLQSLSNADGMRLIVTATGPLVQNYEVEAEEKTTLPNEVAEGINNTLNSLVTNITEMGDNLTEAAVGIQALNVFVDSYNVSSNITINPTEEDTSQQVFTIIAIPIKELSSTEKLKFKMQISAQQDDGTRLNISMVNNKAYYLRQNLTSGDTIVENCITQDLVPPVDEIASSILKASVLEVDDELGLEIVGCGPSGKVVHATWSGHQYLYCIENEKITHIAGSHLTISVEYLDEFTSQQYFNSITVPDDILLLNETITCPELDLTDAGSYFESFIDTTANGSRRLLDIEAPIMEEEHWWLNRNVKHPSVRRLAASIKPHYVSPETYNNVYNIQKIVGCGAICIHELTTSRRGDSATVIEVPFSNLGSVMKASNSLRKLGSTTRSITLPRDCIFIHGAGFDLMGYQYKKQHREAWGEVHRHKPCYCNKMKFVRVDTYNYAWYDKYLQARMLFFFYAENLNTDGSFYPVNIRHRVIFTHFTSSLTFGAMIGSRYIALKESTRWITIQAPTTETVLANKLPAKICTKKNIYLAQQVLRTTQRYSKNDKRWEEQRNFMFKVISVCSPASGTEKQLHWLATLTREWSNLPGSPRTEYFKAARSLGKYVNAALCGISARGMLGTNSEIMQAAQAMGVSRTKLNRSDGVTSISSCVALKSLKLKFGNERINFGTQYTDPFYAGNIAQSDITLHADSKTDIRSKYRKWLNHLNLIQDA